MIGTLLIDNARDDGTAVVRFVGELDMSCAERAQAAGISALSQLDPGSPLVLDVSELAFCDSFGLKALIGIRGEAERSGHRVVLRRPSALLERMLRLTDLRGHFIVDGNPALT